MIRYRGYEILFGLSLSVALVGCGSSKDEPESDGNVILATTFDSDPTMQKISGTQAWVIRDHESNHFGDAHPGLSIDGDVLRFDSTGGDCCLDSRPRTDFPDGTEMVFSTRSASNEVFQDDVAPQAGDLFPDWPWAGTNNWINFEYDVANAHWAAAAVMIYRRESVGDQVLFLMNQIDDAPGSTNLTHKIIYVQTGLPLDEFVDVKLKLLISSHELGLTVNGEDQGKVGYELKYEAASKDDRFTAIAPNQGVQELKYLKLVAP
jgi:hypothetical protein